MPNKEGYLAPQVKEILSVSAIYILPVRVIYLCLLLLFLRQYWLSSLGVQLRCCLIDSRVVSGMQHL